MMASLCREWAGYVGQRARQRRGSRCVLVASLTAGRRVTTPAVGAYRLRWAHLAEDPMVNSPWRRLRPAAIGGAIILVALPVVLLASPPHVAPKETERTDEAAELCRQSEAAGRAADFHTALTLADRAVQAAPSYAPGYARRGRVKFFLGDEDGTLADCDQAIRRDPALAVAYAYRAPVAGLRGGPAAGLADAAKALQLDPNLPGRAACAALAWLNAGDLAGADREATAAAEATDAAEGHRVRGLVLQARGDAQAKAEFDDA